MDLQYIIESMSWVGSLALPSLFIIFPSLILAFVVMWRADGKKFTRNVWLTIWLFVAFISYPAYTMGLKLMPSFYANFFILAFSIYVFFQLRRESLLAALLTLPLPIWVILDGSLTFLVVMDKWLAG